MCRVQAAVTAFDDKSSSDVWSWLDTFDFPREEKQPPPGSAVPPSPAMAGLLTLMRGAVASQGRRKNPDEVINLCFCPDGISMKPHG